jgi:hypothetical protein
MNNVKYLTNFSMHQDSCFLSIFRIHLTNCYLSIEIEISFTSLSLLRNEFTMQWMFDIAIQILYARVIKFSICFER